MRIFSVNLFAAFGNLFAGCLAGIAIQQSGSATSYGLIALAVVVFASLLCWQFAKFDSAVRQLSAFITSPRCDSTLRSGLQDLDALAGNLIPSLQSEKPAVETEGSLPKLERDLIQQFNQIERLLNEFETDSGSGANVGEDIVARLQNAITSSERPVTNAMQQALACSREIAKETQHLIAGADSQSDSINRTTSVVETLSSQLIKLNDNAEFAVKSSAQAKSFATDGMSEFQAINKELEAVRNQSSTRERKLQLLNQHAREISKLVDAVGHLSSKTDLLALNASIESVRAGEHGRGFALVAEEVRSLATQSAQSVADISEKVERMQHETQESLAVAMGEQEQVQRLIQHTSGALNSMNQINDSSTQWADRANEISQVAQDQLNQLMQIVRELESSSEISKGNRIHAEGVHWTAKTLEQLGESVVNPSSSAGRSHASLPASNMVLDPQV